jgi:CBS domain-containing protein
MSQVSEVMTRGVRTMRPDDSLVQAAQAMDALDVGALPVCDGERLVGMLTDRDIVLRGVAQGRTPEQTRLAEVMTAEVDYCFDDDSLESVAERMQRAQIRRLPVVDHDKRLVGIVSLGDVAVKGDAPSDAAQALAGVSEPARPDRSSQSQASGSAGGGEQRSVQQSEQSHRSSDKQEQVQQQSDQGRGQHGNPRQAEPGAYDQSQTEQGKGNPKR